jgi:hypothetical protein
MLAFALALVSIGVHIPEFCCRGITGVGVGGQENYFPPVTCHHWKKMFVAKIFVVRKIFGARQRASLLCILFRAHDRKNA